MGYRKVPTIYTFEFENHPGLEVRLKSIKIGRLRKVVQLLDKQDVPDEEQIDEILNLFAEALISWNLEEEDGTPVPADMAGIEDQDFTFILMILDTWMAGLTGPSDDLGKGSDSGETSPVPLPTMESL